MRGSDSGIAASFWGTTDCMTLRCVASRRAAQYWRPMLLVGDVGATHARLALISREHGLARPIREANLPSRRYESLEALIGEFLTPLPSTRIERAVFARSEEHTSELQSQSNL